MQKISKKRSPGSEFIRSYENMRGMNLTAGKENTQCFGYLENMYVDYEGGGGAVESIPGYRRIYSFDAPIHLICSVGEHLLIHSGENLFKLRKEARDNPPALQPVATLADCDSRCFRIGGSMVIFDGNKAIRANREGELCELALSEEVAACTAGTIHEGRLLLTSSISAPGVLFCAEGDEENLSISPCFKLPRDTLNIASAYGYLWAFTTDSVLGYRRINGEFIEEIRLGGIRPTGEVAHLYNELVFLCNSGLYSLSVTNGAELKRISVAINTMLLNENLFSARLCVWRGYLLVCVDGRMYMADSRDRITSDDLNEYRWYYLSGIGSYRGDKRVYRYAETAPEEFAVQAHPGRIAEGEIMSLFTHDGEKIYFVNSSDKKFAVYPTEQMIGGRFFPANCMCESEDLLFFGTECGDLCLFNNDMRGKPPRRAAMWDGFDNESYLAETKSKIHPDYYSFCGHAPRYALLTPPDRCGMPFNKKSDVPSALELKLKSFPSATIKVETRYDGGAYEPMGQITGSSFDFYNIDFSSYSSTSEELSGVILPQKRVGWNEKQISIYSDEFCSPFGIYSICFAYKASKTKNHYKKGK